jgi:hypothetical protein
MSTVLSVDQINLGLLILAGLAAYLLPFELLLVSYAFLGPLHYLTEISWLHDRKYFTLNKADPLILTISSLLFLFLGLFIFSESAEFVWALLLLAFCTAFLKSWWYRLFLMVGGVVVLWLLFGSTVSYVAAVMIPTVVHVFLFTLLFMVLGAMRAKSFLGYINASLFVVGSVVLLLLPPFEVTLWPSFVSANYSFFAAISEAISQLLPYETGAVVAKMAGFLAFAYTYHYLNWFSKTSIIEWHHISSARAFVIGLLYAVSIGIYMKDYALGLVVLLSLSFLHVVLEFPLNFKSIHGIWEQAYKGFGGQK